MKLLMVCLGNICRSPLAQGIMEHEIAKAGLDWTVDSAGTGNWHIGEGPDHRSVSTARNHGVDISKQVCRQFKPRDFDEFDVIFVMDKNNLSDVLNMARTDADAAKVQLLLVDKEVPDPYYDSNKFEPVFELIEGACKDVIRRLKGSEFKN